MFAWIKDDLNPEQEKAITTPGNVFLVACPGSGKTKALTYKAALELSRLKSEKQFVVAITYTHRAADEIHERIESLGVDASQLWIGTIHSFCLEWILKPYAVYHATLSRGFSVLNSHESEQILTDLCRSYNKGVTYWDCSYYVTSTGYRLGCRDEWKHETLHKIFSDYFAILARNRQIDFELILYYAHELIKAKPQVSVLLSRIFPFILVDEYQDTKQIQYEIVASILRAGEGRTNAFIVGDPNQAIYHSLGGFPMAPGDFKDLAKIELTELALSRNYRSSEKIIKYFYNYGVQPANIDPSSQNKNYPSLITYNTAVLRTQLEDELIRLIKFNIEQKNIPPHEICILAPQWVHLASITRKLVASLPGYHFDGPGMVPFSRDIDNFWYKLSKIALTQASPGMYVRRMRWAGEVLKDLEDVGVDVSSVDRKCLLRECNSISRPEIDGLAHLAAFFTELFQRLGIDFQTVPVLQAHHVSFFESSQSRIDRLKSEGTTFIGDIATFRRVFEERRGVTVSTIHGIKGDEYDVVVAYALLEGMVPHFSDPEGPQSAMKLLYVLCSRARKNLHLISEQQRPRGRSGYTYKATEKLQHCIYDYDVV